MQVEYLSPKDCSSEDLFKRTDHERLHLERWLPWVSNVRSAADSQETLNRFQQEEVAGKALHWVLSQKHPKNIVSPVIGVISLMMPIHAFYPKHDYPCVIGYWLAEEAQGHGIITKACQALMQEGINRYDTQHFYIACKPDNTKSIAIPKRLGFTYLHSTALATSSKPLSMFHLYRWSVTHKPF